MSSRSTLRSWWSSFITSGYADDLPNAELRLVKIINVTTLIGVISLIVFGTINLQTNDYVTGLSEFMLATIGVLNILLLRESREKMQLAATNLLLIMIALFLILLFSGGVARTGIYWFSVFPPVSFFLKGKRQGLYWMLAFLFLILFLALLAGFGTTTLMYSWVELRQMVASLLVISVLMYFYYEYIHSQDQTVLHTREAELLKQSQSLRAQLKQERQAKQQQADVIDQIDRTIIEIQRKNKDLEDTKAAMLNLLEDLEEAKQRVEEDKAKDVALLSSLGEGMIATDEQNTVIVVNREAEELLGVNQQALIGKQLFDVVPARQASGRLLEPTSRLYTKAFKTGKPLVSTDQELQRANKQWFPAALTASPVVKGKEQIGGVIVFRDITKEKQIDKAKTEFVSLASHQLRTPLSAANWYVEMLLSGDAGKITKEQREYLQEIHHGNQRLVDLVNSLLNVSRLELGTFMVEPKPIQLTEVSDSIVKELAPLAEKRDVTLKRSYGRDIPVMKADENLVRMILQNLVSNAIKYNKDHGSVTVGVHKKDDWLVLTVKDTGIGIPKNQLKRIFEKLFRADNVLKTDTDGTGLGLYIVKQILDETGGDITLHSVIHKGTEFTVKLPVSGMKRRAGNRRLS